MSALRSPRIWLGLIAPLAVYLANLRPVWDYTVDDAFISFRYARNLARGDGLVYNVGERVEGITNLLWTLLLAATHRIGLPIELAAKGIGVAAGIALIVCVYILGRRLSPTAWPLAPWLLATSIGTTAFSVSGLETVAAALVVVALAMQLRWERDDSQRRLGSALIWSIGCLLRPELALHGAVLTAAIIGVPRTRRDGLRLALVAMTLLGMTSVRWLYYGAFAPNTFGAKVAVGGAQLEYGLAYVGSFAWAIAPVLGLAAWGLVATAVPRRERIAFGGMVAAIALVSIGVGGDWMAAWRYLVPAEPFVYLLAEAGLAAAIVPSRRVRVGVLIMLSAVATWRVVTLREQQRELVLIDERTWVTTVQNLASWLREQPPGLVAVGDIGRIGWTTDFPIFDYNGLVTREMTIELRKRRRGEPNAARERLRAAHPRYVVFPATDATCTQPVAAYRPLIAIERRRLLATFTGEALAPWCVYADSTSTQLK